jgi:DNA-binding XRE family transcriptional regulator
MTAEPRPLPEADAVLCKALFNAKDILSLTQTDLGLAIGLDRTSITRIKQKGVIDPQSKTGELATYVIRIFRDLYALMGGDKAAIQHWMKTYNNHLNGQPSELIHKAQGLVLVLGYLDAMRGKV